MNKSKTPHRSRLIRKWDGTPIVGEQHRTPPETPAIQQDSDQRPAPAALTFEFDRENVLTDTLER